MIRMKNIRYRYPGTGWVLKGIDLSIQRREYITVFGSMDLENPLLAIS